MLLMTGCGDNSTILQVVVMFVKIFGAGDGEAVGDM